MAPRRSAHSRPVRQSRSQVTSYHEDSSSDESDHNQGSSASVSLRPRDKKDFQYREQSTDEELVAADSSHGELSEPDATHPGGPPASLNPSLESSTQKAQRISQATRSSTRVASRKRRTGKAKQVGQPLKKRSKVSVEDSNIISPGVIPPWQTLPYQILLDIFLRVFPPLDDPKSSTTKVSAKSIEAKSASTLLRIARLCRAFHEPAMAALYYSPPLSSAYKGHGLLNLLSMPPGSLSMNYAGKIRELHIDAETVLTLKSGPTLGYFDLAQLVLKTPRLHTLQLYHQEDKILGIPHWNLLPSKWSYPESLFSAIDTRGIRLYRWEWNGRFLPIDELLVFMLHQHLRPGFQHMKELRLIHLSDTDRADTQGKEAALATALKGLPEIERLEFVECSMVADTILLQLPLTIRSLTICNCDRLFSSHILELLQTHGEQLRELNLDHNRHMNMAFMPSLGKLCPKLERFRMDISMHDWSSYHDVEPHFKDLINSSQYPTWPETLQDLQLFQLRHWNAEAAEAFFNSLIYKAPQLKDLRRLEITAMLETSWRDRARFRERWIERFERVFLRRSAPPNANLRSLQGRPLPASLHTSKENEFERPGSNGSDTQNSSTRHSQRLAELKTSDDHETEYLGSHETEAEFPSKEYMQGMCDQVTIRIDNQRPSDLQFNEDDFLDDEASGDEDWDGDDYEPGGGHAW